MTTIKRKPRRTRLPIERVEQNANILVQRIITTKPFAKQLAKASIGYTTESRKAFKRLVAICYNTTDMEGRTINDVFIDESAQLVVNKAITALKGL